LPGGKPNLNRVWTECFAQLVGTILSFWDAEALDAAGQDGEVAPSFINLADASIKMVSAARGLWTSISNGDQIETLPTRDHQVQPLQNVLSISTAGKNRYLLHFNSLHSLTQWTAGIRLAMFENASLHELYTGSLIAGKGKHLNSINQIMTKNKFRIEDWARVRFGAGTPWRRCWCVIEPPDEKEWQKSQKKLSKRSPYDKTALPKGDIKFYDTKKIKKATPIATITDAYSAYAIYPQSRLLINESTLIKLEGKITIHSNPESKTEGFVFVMPEVHPAVAGFEMMLRWLMPVYDTFSLYGRPNRLVPDTLDTRSLMFAMPRERRYGYLDIIDIATLIHTEGSDKWSEREWRKKLKDAVSRRMSMQSQGRASNIENVRPANSREGMNISESSSTHPLQFAHKHNQSTDAVFESPRKAYTAPTQIAHNYHSRSASETIQISPPKMRQPMTREYTPTRMSEEPTSPENSHFPPPMPLQQRQPLRPRVNDVGYMESANSSDSEIQPHIYPEDVEGDLIQRKPVQPVVAPPEFNHQPNEQPRKRPMDRPEMRREKSRMSDATLAQLNPRVLEELKRENAAQQHEQGAAAASAAAYAWRGQNGASQSPSRGVNETPADAHETLTNTQRPAVVTNPSSTSIDSTNTKPKPLLYSTIINGNGNDARSGYQRTLSNPANASMPYYRDSTPDYDQLPRARGGIRKTVGDPNVQAQAQEISPENNLHIDFGVTQRLTPENSRPGTASGQRSPFETIGRSDSSSGRRSPFDSLGLLSTGPKSPLNPSAPQAPRTPEKSSPRDRPTHSRTQSLAWQPGAQPGSGSPEGLSAEEFVQQRVAMAMRPQGYVTQRTLSSGRIEQIKGDQRPESPIEKSPRRLQKRTPTSRNSSANSIDYSHHLSAREQEHVARITGGPLINMNQPSRTPDPSVGLIGAIEARQQEKRNIKEGLQGQMVQAAIDQRTRESRALQMQQYQANNPFQYPQAQDNQPRYAYAGYSQPQQQHQQEYQPTYIAQQTQQRHPLQRPQSQISYGPRPAQERLQSQWSQWGQFYAPQR